jgi:hypothetical protein
MESKYNRVIFRTMLVSFTAVMLLVSAGTVFAGDNSNTDHKITICHIPPGDPGNAHTIVIDESAWPAHEAHGDYIGECQKQPPPPVSELPTIALMGFGILGLLFISRRKN